MVIEVRTDEPAVRFAPGAELLADDGRTLTVDGAKDQSGRFLVRFREAADRTAAEGLRGLLLEADIDPAAVPNEPDTYYDRQLIGLTVVDAQDLPLGIVIDVLHLPAQDVLVVASDSAGESANRRQRDRAEDPETDEPQVDEPQVDEPEVLVPFVADIVRAVELDRDRIVVTPPDGLFPDGDRRRDAAPGSSDPGDVSQGGGARP